MLLVILLATITSQTAGRCPSTSAGRCAPAYAQGDGVMRENAPIRVRRPARPKFAQHRLMPPPSQGTPLVLVFDGGHAELEERAEPFAFEPGAPQYSAWPSDRTPWLVRDLNENGRLDSGRELLGSWTLLRDGRFAENGFEALSDLDENGDGTLDKSDLASFGQLKLL